MLSRPRGLAAAISRPDALGFQSGNLSGSQEIYLAPCDRHHARFRVQHDLTHPRTGLNVHHAIKIRRDACHTLYIGNGDACRS